MNKESLVPELEEMMKKVRLKEPTEGLMKDYLSGVNAKIDRGASSLHFEFPQLFVALVIGLAIAGGIYFFITKSHIEPVKNDEVVSKSSTELVTPRQISIEEEMAILETFNEELTEEMTALFSDDELFQELAQLDELEISLPLNNRVSGV